MQKELAFSPRIGEDNSKSGAFASETVADILLRAAILIDALCLNIDIQESVK